MESVKIEVDEEKIINSESFDSEYFDAIECARETAKHDKAAILSKIKEEYQDVFGEEATNEIIMEAFSNFVSSADEAEQEEEDEYDDEEFEDEEEAQEVDPDDMELALSNVRQLAKQHQSKFVENVTTTFKIINGFEPSQDDLSSIFEGIRHQFADEIKEEFLDQIDYEQQSNEDDEDIQSS